jgi:hypothetical protein
MPPQEPSKSKRNGSPKFQETYGRDASPELKQGEGGKRESLSLRTTDRQWGVTPSFTQRVATKSLEHILFLPFFILAAVICSHFVILTHANMSRIGLVLVAAWFAQRWLLNRMQLSLRKATIRLFVAFFVLVFVSMGTASIISGNNQTDATKFYSEGQYRKAVDSYNAAFAVIPIYDVRELEERADSYLHLNEYQKALSDYDMAVILQDDKASQCKGKWYYKSERQLAGKFHYLRSIVYDRMGRAELASADKQKAKQFGYSVGEKKDVPLKSTSGTQAVSEKP